MRELDEDGRVIRGVVDGLDVTTPCGWCGASWGRHKVTSYGACPDESGRHFVAGTTTVKRRLMDQFTHYVQGPDGQVQPVMTKDGEAMARRLTEQLLTPKRGGAMHVSERVEELKNFNVDRLSVEEMVYLAVEAQRLREGFEARAMPAPEWLMDQIRTLNVEIDRRKRDDLEKRLKELKSADAADMTASERREARRLERERIEKELAGQTA